MPLASTINQFQRKVPTWPFYLVLGAIPFWWLYLGFTGGLGVEPIKELEHRLGELGLQVLIASLAVTPLRKFAGVNLIRFRRMLGLMTFYLISLHLLVWLVLDVQIVSQIWADILKRPYITVGMVGFVLMIPLALTSNNWSIRRLGPVRWRRLHQLVYITAILGAVHFVLLVKGWQIEPLIYLGVILALLATRLRLPRALVRA
ncbi:protein-methionine-sulfoxide reductase heme-binding subunit MsrQ [Oceaniglobus ichthyenteri]|uniref:protein-methionine-sulfoxide reductase heme-binding subunit MsrQ n=1 Tax=Oceaniglobus ichthyenteri TaxID=2136177 RepID=UPI000D3523EA|nr:protein-methionine-sulfoxide reductase heme-binding subunit MsrQ [Oceaniglobus ichthyenteri]